MGYRNLFLTVTCGLGILTSLFETYAPWKGVIPKRINGVLIANSNGNATAYAIGNIQKRGTLFCKPSRCGLRGDGCG